MLHVHINVTRMHINLHLYDIPIRVYKCDKEENLIYIFLTNMDAVLIANEIVDEKRRSGEEGVVFKIDFEKAYDHVSWDFLDHVMEMKGFGIRWRKWMRGCLSSVSYAVLVNGNAKGWVKASRGLRQGDPLSPFLFTIVADVLSRMLLKAEERNVLEGFRVGRNRDRKSTRLNSSH